MNAIDQPAGLTTGTQLLLAKLAEPFPASEIHWKPQAVKGNRALALAYVTNRSIMDRLDNVLGVDGWKDDYEIVAGGSVVCRLSVRIGERWIAKVDVGSPSEQPDEGDRMKAAFSDAMKRAAVKYGIGRYLYRLPQQWHDFDPQTKKFVRPPTLPAEAMPEADRKKPNSQVRDSQPGPAIPPARNTLNGKALVNAAEVKEIAELLKRAGITERYFCETFDVPRLEDLSQERYPEAVKRIQAKIPAAA